MKHFEITSNSIDEVGEADVRARAEFELTTRFDGQASVEADTAHSDNAFSTRRCRAARSPQRVACSYHELEFDPNSSIVARVKA